MVLAAEAGGLVAGMNQLLTLAGNTIGAIIADPNLVLFFAAGLVGVIVGVIHKVKRA